MTDKLIGCVGHDCTECAEQKAEIARLRTRLEWREDGYDGIFCRDETIRLQDKAIDELRAENHKLREALRRHAITTCPNRNWKHCVECSTDWAGDAEVHKPECIAALAGDRT